MRRIVVTGGAGLVGSHLVRALLVEGAEVVVLDDFSSGSGLHLPRARRLRVVRGSVLDRRALARAFGRRPAVVYHLAAFIANQRSVEEPERDLEVNVLGTLRALEAAVEAKAGRFVFASAGCSVYGPDAPNPVREDLPVSLVQETPYQISKVAGEMHCLYVQERYGIPTVRARFFNVYGPGETPGRYRNVVTNFCWWAIHGRPLPITGTGRETRDFVHAADLARGLVACGRSRRVLGEAVQFAGGREVRILDLAHQVNRLAGNEAGVIFHPRRPWDRVERRWASITRARRLLGWRPAKDLSEGLQETIEFLRRHRRRLERLVEE